MYERGEAKLAMRAASTFGESGFSYDEFPSSEDSIGSAEPCLMLGRVGACGYPLGALGLETFVPNFLTFCELLDLLTADN